MFTSHSGSAPAPFDAVNGGRLAGSQGSHPLHDVAIEELLNPGNGSLAGSISVEGRARVGDPIRGTIDIVAQKQINARGANLRLVGLRLVEQQHSTTHKTGDTTTTETWVEANGRLFDVSPFLEPAIPTTMAAGEAFKASFAIPGPALGPPSAHLGEAIVAWALEVRFDIPMGSDAFIATLLPVAQHPDLLAAGVGRQGGLSMLASVDSDGGTISIEPRLPAMAGASISVAARWASAPGGPARIELHRRSTAPNGINAIIASADTTGADLASGAARASLAIPPDASPSFDGADLQLFYIVRVLVNRRFRPDAAIERLVAIA
ncbi:MAG TPA: hypothetical protein VJ850_00445 [Candidatus Limnocylindrales bacterium]|nr:hypothetical protein [Candidatus Limnocylindrales bacterium]